MTEPFEYCTFPVITNEKTFMTTRIDLKSAAHQAAAKHSTNRALATIEYAKLSGQFDHKLSEEEIKALTAEMLSFLPEYRHPTFDEFGECMWFIDPNGPCGNGTAYSLPSFLKKLEDTEIDRKLLAEIEEYTKKAELEKIDLATCSGELEEFRAIISESQRIYYENASELRSDKRNALVVQALGLSKGVVPKRIDKKKAYIDYVGFVRKTGMSPSNAVEEVQRKYGINSYDATLKMLYEYRGTIFKKYKTLYPTLLPKLRSLFRGFIPSRR